MTGRGIDQILPHPGDTALHESHARSALLYVNLAEKRSGPIDRPVDFGYVWGDALSELDRRQPDARIVNLETAVTRGDDPWPTKGIHYRMNPANAPALTAAKIDCCVLANNHVLDFGEAGLIETLKTLAAAGIATSGAGRHADEASVPARIKLSRSESLLVFAFATESSGVPPDWAATERRAGVNLLTDLSPRAVERVAQDIAAHRREGDVIVVSLHWGGNWGYDVSGEERQFAHALIDEAGADLVHGHSSHHAKGIEVHDGKLVLYGCGDFVNDYEGIGGYESYRTDLALMYFLELDSSGQLPRLTLVPMRRRRFSLTQAHADDIDWICQTISAASSDFGTSVVTARAGELELRWGRSGS